MIAKHLATMLLLATVTCLLTACDGEGNQPAGKDDSFEKGKAVILATDKIDKYIKNDDATEFMEDWSQENTVIVHVIGEPRELHPTNGTTGMRMYIYQYTQMFMMGNDLEHLDVRPGLVKSMPEVSSDELEYTYELRDEPRWDDGQQLSVDDILFTFKAQMCALTNNPFAKPYFEKTRNVVIDKDNPRRFIVQMKHKYIQSVNLLISIPVMQRTYFDPGNVMVNYTPMQLIDKSFDADQHADLVEWAKEFNDSKYGRDPQYLTGMGAYRVAAWDAGQSITLERKKDHWTASLSEPSVYENSYPEKIIFKVNRDKNSQMLEMESQALDVSTYLSAASLLELQKSPNFNRNYHCAFVPAFTYTYMGLNCRPDGVKRKKLFTDRNVRRAIALLTPVDDINRLISKGKAPRMCTPVSPLKYDCNTNLKPLPYDVEEARQLLTEAHWVDTDGDNIRDKMIDGERVKFSFEINYMNVQVEWKDMAQMIAESMLEAGVEVILKPLDPSPLYKLAENHDFDAMLGSWQSDAHPDDHSQLWHTDAWKNKSHNFTGFGNAESDALIDSINSTLDFEKRKQLSMQFQQLIYDEQPYVFMTSGMRRVAIHKRFKNGHMYFEKPSVILSNLKLFSPQGSPLKTGMSAF